MESATAPDTLAPQRAAASLAYAGLSGADLETTLEVLGRLGLLAMFYPSPIQLVEDANKWRAVRAKGHEIGNNSFHGVSVGGNLHNWTLNMVSADLHETERLIEELFPDQKGHSFLYPGPECTCLESLDDQVQVPYSPVIEERFQASLLPLPGINSPGAAPHGLRTTLLRDPDDAMHTASEAREDGGWVIFLIDDLSVPSVHERVCTWLAEQRPSIVTAPFVEMAARLGAVGVKR